MVAVLNDSIKSLALKFALKNAIDYGSAKVAPVLGMLLAEKPELRADLKGLEKELEEIVGTVNRMSKGALLEAYAPYREEFEEKERKKKEQTSAPNMVLEGAVVGNFAARFPPEPNGYMHIGNAKQAFLSQEFAKKYKGKLFLYFDDTNPDKDKQEFVEAIKQDAQWLGIKFDGEYYASDMIEQIHGYAMELIEQGGAYVCFCDKDTINKNRANKRECQHRSQAPSENAEYFKRMLTGDYKEGSAVVRFKGDMGSENTVMRDPTLLRIKLHPHYRQGSKYKVWPTYYFNTPINDSVHGITDAIRSKEYELSDDLYKAVLLALGMRVPRVHDMARLKIIGTSTHKRELKELIEKGYVSGYDDPRLVTIAALRRRGIEPEAIRRFVLRFGMSKTDSAVSMSMLLAENRKLIDGVAKRLFLVTEPFEVDVSGLRSSEVSLRLHPSANIGFRKYAVSSKFYIEKRDAGKLHVNSIFCLKDLACVKVIKLLGNKIEASFVEPSPELLASAPKLQWVNEGNCMQCKVALVGDLMVNGKYNSSSLVIKQGLVEAYAKELREGDTVNFERVGFFKLDKMEQGIPMFLSL
ncbi:MAG: glutamate--tRNA ligase [Candidatus Micrarchaeaceae archaeon]